VMPARGGRPVPSGPMGRRWGRGVLPVALAAVIAAGCATAAGQDQALVRADAPVPTTEALVEDAPVGAETGPAPEVAPVEAPAATEAPAPTAPPATDPPPPPPPPRTVWEQPFTPFAAVEGVVLLHPAAHVELIGYHEAGHSGARELEPLESSVPHVVLESRDRGTTPRSAADIVVDPDGEIRAPVSGVVRRAGTYVLYCDHSDDYAVIEPDARPGWEVKVLHIDGVTVRAGDRVEAGATVIAPRPTPLPFRSQIDDLTAEPSWPHVHVEVVDPSIPNQARGGRAC
jgi:biotin carboxyl carrier protein